VLNKQDYKCKEEEKKYVQQELENNKEQGHWLKKPGLKLQKFKNKDKENRPVREERDEFDSFDGYFRFYKIKLMKIKQLAQEDINFHLY